MTTQQKPEALRLADYLEEMANELVFTHFTMDMDAAAVELRRLHAENERLAALVEAQQPANCGNTPYDEGPFTLAQQPAPSAAAAPDDDGYWGGGAPTKYAPQPSPTPQADSAPASLAGPMQFGGCPECGSRSCVARECSRTVSHKAQAIPGVQWQCGPQASGFTAQAADSQPAPIMPRGESAAPGLRAMATNYPAGHLWDKLDAKTCIRGALEIEALRAARAPADSVTAPAGGVVGAPTPTDGNNIPGMAEKALAKLKSHIDHVTCGRGHWETRHLKDALFDLEWIVRRKLAAPPAQAADSVLEDAARLLESQHTWITNVAAANLVRGFVAIAQQKEGL